MLPALSRVVTLSNGKRVRYHYCRVCPDYWQAVTPIDQSCQYRCSQCGTWHGAEPLGQMDLFSGTSASPAQQAMSA